MSNVYRDPVLLVEDTPSLSVAYRAVLEKAGYTVVCAYTPKEALRIFRETAIKIVLLNLSCSGDDQQMLLRGICEHDPEAKVIILTENSSVNRAVEAMRCGAFDFFLKPFDERRLLSAVNCATETLDKTFRGKPGPASAKPTASDLSDFVGSSPKMLEIYAMVRSVSRSNATVFITGESGTGKEVTARSIHAISSRSKGPFVPINCGAIPRDLLESEVFGHLKGSFTGAICDRIGAAAAADGGTLFLDEICEMDLSLQTKLLRFLQTSTIQPVGATDLRKIDVRIICATNRDPLEEVRAGHFREDLFYRLHVVPIALPPLCERGDDVLEISHYILENFSREEGKNFKGLSPETAEIFRKYPWPGNVRQLQNVLRHAVVLHDGESITPDMLPIEIFQKSQNRPAGTVSGSNLHRLKISPVSAANTPSRPEQRHPNTDATTAIGSLVGMSLADMEREFIEASIQACHGSIPRAAKLLDVSPSTLYRKREAWSNTTEQQAAERKKTLIFPGS